MKGERKIARMYMLLSLLRSSGGAFTIAIYSLFLKQRGLNFLETNLVEASFFLTNLLLEVPTGALTDTLGAKRCFVAAGVISTTAFVAIAFGTNIPMLMIAVTLAGIGSVLANGTLMTWATRQFEGLGHTHDEAAALVRLANRRIFRAGCIISVCSVIVGTTLFDRPLLASLLTPVIGRPLAHEVGSYHLVYPWLLGAVSLFVCMVAALCFMPSDMKQIRRITLRRIVCGSLAKIRTGWRYTRHHTTLQFTLGLALAFAISIKCVDMQWSLLFCPDRRNVSSLAFVWALVAVALQSGAQFEGFLIRRIEKLRIIEELLLVGALITVSTGIFCAGVSSALGGSLGWFLVYEFGRGAFTPLQQAYINQQVSDKGHRVRATILSIGSLPLHAGGVIGLLASGFVAQSLRAYNPESLAIRLTWQVFGLGLAVVLAMLVLRRVNQYRSGEAS